MTSKVMDSDFPFSDTAGVAMTAEVSEEAKIMKKSIFSRWFAVLLLFSAFAWWASVSIRQVAAMDNGMSAPTPSNDPAAIEAVKKVSQDMGDAMVAVDIDKLNQIFADDWATVASDGKIFTKQGLLSDFKSGNHKLEWFENGPIDVQVFGNVALAQGGTKEKRSDNGKDTSGQFLWQDVLQRRAGKWAVWRSAGARVVFANTPNAQSQDPAVVAAVKKFDTQDLGDAMVAADIEKINRTYADDWADIGSDGKVFTKQGLLEDFKSGNHKLVSFELGPVDTQVLGDVAIVQASVTEKRIQDGKDISGQFVFTDLLKKRAGKWVIVRTLGSRVS
jgi:ketosteroid isomerase-like protein